MEVNPAEVVAEVRELLAMRSEPTAVGRIDAVQDRLEEYFENPRAARFFRDSTTTKYVRGPDARVITAALVRGPKPREFKEFVEAALEMKESWKEDPVAVFALVRAKALTWRAVRKPRGLDLNGGPRENLLTTPGGNLTCWACGEAGHKSTSCTSAGSLGSGADSALSRGSGGDARSSAARTQGVWRRSRYTQQPTGRLLSWFLCLPQVR